MLTYIGLGQFMPILNCYMRKRDTKRCFNLDVSTPHGPSIDQ